MSNVYAVLVLAALTVVICHGKPLKPFWGHFMSAAGQVRCPDGRAPFEGHVQLWEEDIASDDKATGANRWETDTDEQTGDFYVEGHVEDGSLPVDGPIPEPYLWVTGRCAEGNVYSRKLSQKHYVKCGVRTIEWEVIVLTGVANSPDQPNC